MIGFVIGNKKGKYLSGDKVWYHNKPEDAWVFPVDEASLIFAEALSNKWESQPDRIITAQWTKEKGVTIYGLEKRVQLKLVDVIDKKER